MLASALIDSIRAIFLHREPYVTKKAARAMLGCTVAAIKAAMAAGNVETSETCRGERQPLHQPQRWHARAGRSSPSRRH